MLRCRRPRTGELGVLGSCALALTCACSSAPAHPGSEPASVSGDSAAASLGGATAAAATGGHAPSNSSNSGGEPSTGGSVGSSSGGSDATSLGGSADEAGAAGMAGGSTSGTRSIFYLDVQGRVLSFDEDRPSARTLVRSAGQGPDGIAVDVAGGHVF